MLGMVPVLGARGCVLGRVWCVSGLVVGGGGQWCCGCVVLCVLVWWACVCSGVGVGVFCCVF